MSVREAWGGYSAKFAAEKAGERQRASLRKLLELTAPDAGARVLDVATGAGNTAFAFAARGCRVVGLDPTHEMLLAARQGWSGQGIEGSLPLVEAWAELFPFAGESFDLVVSHRAPHQFDDPAGFVGEARWALRDGGSLAIADQSPPDGWEDWHNEVERLRDPTHRRALSMRQWLRIIEAAGLTCRAAATVYQPHDVEVWMDRVDCPSHRRRAVVEMLLSAPWQVRHAYQIEVIDGRVRMRTPHTVLVARR